MVPLEEIKRFDVQPLSSSSKQQLYVITYGDKHFEVSESVMELVEILKANRSLEEVSVRLSEKNGKEYSRENIKGLIDTYINPIIETKEKKASSYIWLKRELISGHTLRPLTHYLSYLFRPVVVWGITACIVAAQGYFFFFTDAGQAVNGAAPFSFISLLFIGSLFFLSIIFHELGHASACRYYGVEHGHIGVGLYLHFPVFYADVSNIWRLGRRERIVVDLAGIYFQLVFLIPIILGYGFIQSTDLRYVIYAINLSFLFDLNPFFRFDGYWVFTDLLGIANLRQRTREVVSYVGKKLRRKKIPELPYLFKINKREKYFFIGYVIISNLFFGYYILYRMPLFLFSYVKTIPGELRLMFENYATGNPFSFALLGSILMQLVFILIMLYILYKVSTKIYYYIARKTS